MGAKSTYNERDANEICERLSKGEPLRAICKDDHLPALRTVYLWKEMFPEFAAQFVRAREVGGDAIADEVIAILDERPERCDSGGNGGTRVDPGYVQWQKNRAEYRVRLLAKWFPKKYGDRIEIEGNVNISIAERLARARQRKAQADAENDDDDLVG